MVNLTSKLPLPFASGFSFSRYHNGGSLLFFNVNNNQHHLEVNSLTTCNFSRCAKNTGIITNEEDR